MFPAAFRKELHFVVPEIGKLFKDETWDVRYAAVVTISELAEKRMFFLRVG